MKTSIMTALLVAMALTLSACIVGPKYQKPMVETPAAYKEWKAAEPGDAAPRGGRSIVMLDLIAVAVTILFFALALLYVRFCEKI